MRIVIHADMNNFYASVEALHNPALRGVPLVVGGDEQARHGIVLAKNYVAKKFGIQTGEALWEARKKCPGITIVPPNFELYMHYSYKFYKLLCRYTDKVERYGPDESWVDLTNTAHLFGGGMAVAQDILHRCLKELGITCSVGLATGGAGNKITAKLASDMLKPNGLTVITGKNYAEKVYPLPVSDLLMIGPKTTAKMHSMEIYTIGDLAKADPSNLQRRYGKLGLTYSIFARGLDQTPVYESSEEEEFIKSVGNGTTTPRDIKNTEEAKPYIYALSESVAARLRGHGFRAQTVQVSIRDKNLMSIDRQAKLRYPTCLSDAIAGAAISLIERQYAWRDPVRSLTIKGCDLKPMDAPLQLALDYDHEADARKESLERAITDLRGRYGHGCIHRGTMMLDLPAVDMNPKDDHTIHPVAYFRDGRGVAVQ